MEKNLFLYKIFGKIFKKVLQYIIPLQYFIHNCIQMLFLYLTSLQINFSEEKQHFKKSLFQHQ